MQIADDNKGIGNIIIECIARYNLRRNNMWICLKCYAKNESYQKECKECSAGKVENTKAVINPQKKEKPSFTPFEQEVLRKLTVSEQNTSKMRDDIKINKMLLVGAYVVVIATSIIVFLKGYILTDATRKWSI